MKQTNEGLLIQAQTKLCMQNEKIIDLQCLFMRENLVIKGIPEDDESWDKTREKVVDLMKNKLGMQFEKNKILSDTWFTASLYSRNPQNRSIPARLI